MAGLLRSASRLRLLFLPSRGARTVAFSPPAPLPASRAVAFISRRHLIYQARNFTVATQEKGDVQEQLPTAVRMKQAKHFDWALNKLDESIKRTGRITKNLLLSVFHNTCRAGCPSGNLALLFLRGCGSLLPELPPSQRTELAHSLWTKLENLGVVYDVSHYNALLKVYLQNEHEFSPVEFLTKMEEANVQPNRVTYQRLIAAYCNKGDIEGASKILGFMKSKELPITESVFNSLVTGHARSGDMESAENIFSVMKNAGVAPGPETYIALLKAYAEKGDLNKIEETLGKIEKADACIFDRDLMDIIFVLAKAGYPQYVQNILEKMRYDRGYVPDAINFCLALITEGLEDTAFQVLKTLRTSLDAKEGVTMDQGNFFLRHCVNMDKPLAKLKHFCAELKEVNMHHAPLQFTLLCALESNKDGLAVDLMRTMKEEGLPVKRHYFWPLLAWHQKNKNVQGTCEVLKAMHEMEVNPDGETYLKFVLTNFEESIERHRLQEMGCPIDNAAFCTAEVTHAALNGKMDKVLAILSSADTPSLDHHQFKNSLIVGFRRSNNIEVCSKITELLYKDGRYCQTPPGPAEAVGYFLYNLIDSMSDSEVQAKEEQLRQYFHQLNKMNIEIPFNIFGSIRRLLNKDRVPELIKDVIQLTDGKRLSEGSRSRFSGLQVSDLEETLEQLKAAGKPVKDVLKQLILALCSEENLQKALEIKAKYEVDMVVGGYLALISLCCRHNNAEEAMNLKDELARKDSSVVLDVNRYIPLVRVLSKDGRLEDAINVLKEMKEKDVLPNDTTGTAFFHLLNAAALQKQIEMVNRLHETIVTLGLVKNTGNLCSTLITVHLEKDDLPAAVEALFDCHKKYKKLPRRHDILCKLIERGDTELLHKVMDFLTTARGEMTMVYDLFFAFLQTGKYKEAKKIIETPGLRAQPNRLQWFAEKCVLHNQVEALENMVEMTEKLFECDRDEMYYYLLQLYRESNDWQKVDSAWTKMQEENVIPRERTLRLIADILKTNNQEVPFDLPKTWYEEHTNETSPSELVENKIFRLCKSKRTEAAYNVLQEAEKNNIVFLPSVYDTVIRALLSKGCLEEALDVENIAKTHIKGFVLNDAASSLLIITQARRDYLKDAISTLENLLKRQQMPSKLAVTRLVQMLGQKGDLESIRRVEEMMGNLSSFIKLSGMLFINNTLLAHINKNDLDGAVAYIEPMFTSGDLRSDLPKQSIAFVFRKLLENKMEAAVEKLSAMAERLAHQFGIYRPVTDLFLEYINSGRVEDAKLLLERCSVISEQKKMLNAFFARTTKKPGQTDKIETVVDLLPDIPLSTVSTYLMKSYALDNNVASAKALYEKMEAEKVQPDELFLKRLAVLLKNAGEPVPFTEPPESFKFYADKLRAEHEELSSDED